MRINREYIELFRINFVQNLYFCQSLLTLNILMFKIIFLQAMKSFHA
jgi:hypothetical protein